MRIAIVSNIRLYREGLAEVLDRRPGIEVVGTAADGEAAIHCVASSLPDVALLDLAMLDCIVTVRALTTRSPDVKVVALGVPEIEPHVLACIEAGIAGYVPRDGSLDDLVATLEGVSVGEIRCSPRIVASLFRRVATLSLEQQRTPDARRLTARETEIIELLDQGLTNKEIARRLYIELATVKNHVHNILEKLGLRSRAEVAAWMRGGRSGPNVSHRPVHSDGEP